MNTATVGGRLRLVPGALLAAAGWPALVTVAGAGVTTGFFAWYALISRAQHGAVFLELTFLSILSASGAAAIGLWHFYARYIARRTDLTYPKALRFDAFSWAALYIMWAGLLAPAGANATGRAIAVALGGFALLKIIFAAAHNRTIGDVALTFVVTRVPIIVIAEIAAIVIGQRPGIHYAASPNPALAVWGRWDAEHYITIATDGYAGTDMAFFPLYPLLIRTIGILTGNHLIAGLLISNVASFFGLLFFYKLVEHQYDRAVAHRATFYISIFPTAVFFSAVYSESLFFALTVASFYYIRERKWLSAGIIGFFASLTRVEGVLLAVPFLIEWLHVVLGNTQSVPAALRKALSSPIRDLARPLAGLTLVPLGLLSYMAYLWVLRGDPLYFSHVQAHWGRHLAWPWESIWHSIRIITRMHAPQIIANSALEVTFTVLMLGVLVAGARRLRPSYSVYMALSILIPMSTSSLMSMPRFALVLFPMFVMFALWGARASANNAIVAFLTVDIGLVYRAVRRLVLGGMSSQILTDTGSEGKRKHRGLRQFVKFGIVGASGFVVNLVFFTVLQRLVANHAASPQYYFIYSAAFLSGGVSNYALNRVWTFRSSAHPGREGAKFMSVSLVALCVGLVISWIAQPYLGHGHKLWFVSTVGAIFVNFFVNKYWTFRSAA